MSTTADAATRTAGAAMRIVITDCDHDSLAVEQRVADEAGAELVLAPPGGREQLVAAAAGADGLVVQYARVDAALLDALPGVRAVGRYGVGVDTVDVAACTERGVAVCNVPDYGTESVSDHAIALALAAARRIAWMDRGVRAGTAGLDAVRPVHQVGGRVFGVVGLGLIGAATARKAAGLGYEVIGADSRLEPGSTVAGVRVVPLEELLRRAHVISLHVPLTESTRGLVGAAELALVRPDAVLVNTSRGGVVDSAALVDALREGRLHGAGLDVHEVEPLPVDHPLAALDTVVLTPHLAWYSEESYGELKRRTVQNVVDVLAGRRPRDVLNPEVLDGGRR
ncbi:C-terminal binding protein [Kineococcus auxinigenes]|uniref:C-terminal binding protein n=1 Tax=unclassified Kineococcus TaxID=2621656 RepID=UPI003D7EF7BA